MNKETHESRLTNLINEIQEKDIATMMKVASKNKMYPKDCLTNGALEKLIKWILVIEGKALAFDKMTHRNVDK